MKYNISINPNDLFNPKWMSSIYLNDNVNVIILPKGFYYDEGILIEVYANSDHFKKYNDNELINQFYLYALGWKALCKACYYSDVHYRGNEHYMSYLTVPFENINDLPSEIQTVILMNLNTLI